MFESNASEYKIDLPIDNDGYVLFKCPHCKECFKLNKFEGERMEVDELFCPECGLRSNRNNFKSDEVDKYVDVLKYNIAIDAINKRLNTKKKKLPLPEILDNDGKYEIIQFECCSVTAKIAFGNNELTTYCPYCGVN